MPRRRVVARRAIASDPVYANELLAKFINHVMYDGKKSVAEGLIYAALEMIKKKTGRDPVDVFTKAIENVRPVTEVKSRRVGGATYQVPVEVRAARSIALAMRWIISFSRKRSERGFALQLAGELLDAADEEGGGRGRGGAVKKKEDTHRMAEANKVFAHYRW